MKKSKEMASKYHKEESKKILERVGDQKDGVERLTFKDIDGILSYLVC